MAVPMVVKKDSKTAPRSDVKKVALMVNQMAVLTVLMKVDR